MTQWMADIQITTKHTGPHGGRVRVGRFILPRHIFVELTGHNGHPDLHMHLEWRDGRAQVIELSIKSKTDGRGIRTSDLALSLDAITRDVFDGEAQIVVEDRADGTTVSAMPDWSDPRWERDHWDVDREIGDAMAANRGAKSREQLANVADVYSSHRGKGALLAVATALGVSERTAARRVKDARAAGLLTEEGS